MLLLSLGAANRDPDVFENPEALDIGRDPNPHLALGFGADYCVGASLARLEAEVALEVLLARFSEISLLDDAPEYRASPVLHGLVRLDLAVA